MSSLSSLLVRDGVVSVKRMERAFQHQVIDGGALDTILLEQELVAEDQLVEYLSAASGLPAASWDDCEVIDDEALRRCPLELASEHDVAPLSFEAGALRVLVRDPFDPTRIAALADRLGVTVEPMIVPEYRWHLVFTRDFDQPPDDRFVTLATSIGAAVGGEVRHRPLQVAAADDGREGASAGEGGEAEEAAVVHAPPPFFDRGEAAVADVTAAAVAPGAPLAAPGADVEAAAAPMTPIAERPTAEVSAAEPTAAEVSAAEPTAAEPTAVEPTTAEPITAEPTTAEPTTADPAAEPTTAEPTTAEPAATAEAPTAELSAEQAAAELASDEPAIIHSTVTAGWDVVPPVEDDLAPSVSAGWSEPVDTAPAPAASAASSSAVDATAATALAPAAEPAAADRAGARGSQATTQELPPWRGDAVDATRDRRGTRPGVAAPAPAPALAPAAAAPAAGAPAPAPARAAFLDEDDRPLDRTAALQLIEVADERDAVFRALLRALRGRTRWAGILVVHAGAAVGRLAIADLGIDTTAFANVSLPLDRPSPFHAVIVGRHPYVGHVTSGEPEIDDMVVRMGGTVPSSALVLPIVLRARCVALAVAHSGAVPITLADVSDLLPLAAIAAQALGRILLSRKREQASGSADPLTPRSPHATTLVPPVTRGGTVSSGVVTAAHDHRDAITATTPVVVAPALRPLSAVLADLESSSGDVVDAAIAEGAARADELLPILPSRFPGPLRADRYAAGRTLPPGHYGPVLALVERIGHRAADVLIDLLGEPERDVRFYAAVCLGAIRPRAALPALAERIFDSDYGVRNVAIEVLQTFGPRDLDQVMAGVRPALHSDDLERVAAVSHAVAALVDVGALGDLVDVVGKDAKRAELARRALVALTRHDMGTSARRWRSWFDEHRSRHRIEWLIDALGHRDQPLREAALEDLRRLTGEDFGGIGDENRRDREALTERWRAWWAKTGRRRFIA
jgi:hypothetical protein